MGNSSHSSNFCDYINDMICPDARLAQTFILFSHLQKGPFQWGITQTVQNFTHLSEQKIKVKECLYFQNITTPATGIIQLLTQKLVS